MAATFNQRKCDVTINGQTHLNVAVAVRQNQGRVLAGTSLLHEMDVVSVENLGRNLFRVTGVDGTVWDVTTGKCGTCG